MIELVVVVIYWTECKPRKFGNEIRLPGTTGIDNLPIPLTMALSRISINITGHKIYFNSLEIRAFALW